MRVSFRPGNRAAGIIPGVLTACFALLVTLPTLAETSTTATEFFRGKTIHYLVANKPGGGYDAYARIIASALERQLPGSRVRVRNVPGAGSIVGANHLYTAPPDGLTIGTFNSGLVYAQLLGMQGVRFDLTRFGWIGKAAEDPRLLIVSAHTAFRSLDDLQRSERAVLFGTPGVGSASHNETVMLARLLGLKIRPVAGLSGGERMMSMLRGEIEANLGSASSNLPFVEQGHARAILRIGASDAMPPGIPEIRDLTGGSPEIIDLIETVAWLGRLTAAPPGMDTQRLALLRKAYLDALHDSELLTEAARMQLPIVPADGEAVSAKLQKVLSTGGTDPKRLRSLISDLEGES